MDELSEELAVPKLSPKVTADSMLDRYYKRLYFPAGAPAADQFVHVHSNRVAVVGICATHPICTSGVEIASIQFCVGSERVSTVKVCVT